MNEHMTSTCFAAADMLAGCSIPMGVMPFFIQSIAFLAQFLARCLLGKNSGRLAGFWLLLFMHRLKKIMAEPRITRHLDHAIEEG